MPGSFNIFNSHFPTFMQYASAASVRNMTSMLNLPGEILLELLFCDTLPSYYGSWRSSCKARPQ
eukprot:5960377-Amphidinium_carterae.1